MSELPFDAPPDRPLECAGDPAAARAPDPLRGQTVVFTGKLWSLGRKEARTLAEHLGGTTDDEVTQRTSLLVLGQETYPDGVPDIAQVEQDTSAGTQKLRRAMQLNQDQPGRIGIVSEDAFCRLVGLPSAANRRESHYGQRDILAMYASLREDQVRYLKTWGFIRPAFRSNADTFYTFHDLAVLRQVHAELQRGQSFRRVLRDLQAARSGQLTLDFRIEAEPARIIALTPREPAHRRSPVAAPGSPSGSASSGMVPGRPLSPGEQQFMVGSTLDDGSPERQDEAAQAYRRALDYDPDLVAAIINLANIRYAHDELAEAQALYERAILLDASYFEAHFNLGNIHHDHGLYREAEACYREALAINPGYADAHFYLAVTLEKTGRSADAREHWRAYQALAPQGEWVELAREFSD
ncbi:MAG: tetratricopeptide repeat protein [Acidobacteriota bacterium]